MNKHERHLKKMAKYKKRVHLFASTCNTYIKRDGTRLHNPKGIDVLNDNGQNRLRTMATVCSCPMCAYLKYNRKNPKYKTQPFQTNFIEKPLRA